MKDSEARDVINLLTKRIRQLDKDLQQVKNPHALDCKCKECQGLTADYFMITVGKKHPFGPVVSYEWWEDNGK